MLGLVLTETHNVDGVNHFIQSIILTVGKDEKRVDLTIDVLGIQSL